MKRFLRVVCVDGGLSSFRVSLVGYPPSSFVLRYVSRMKHPDIRLAWREKFTIFVLIFLMNTLVIFYIVEFGRLLCLNFDKARTTTELAEHTGDSD